MIAKLLLSGTSGRLEHERKTNNMSTERLVFTYGFVVAISFGLLSVMEIGGMSLAVAGETTSEETLDRTVYPETLSPSLFSGAVADGYKIAKAIPHILAEIHCYCGCDRSMGHPDLLHCFVDSHAAG